jgi:hypothetical protein
MDRYDKLCQQIELQCVSGARELSRHIQRLERESMVSRIMRKSRVRY